jgi:uncharacterized protein YkwD
VRNQRLIMAASAMTLLASAIAVATDLPMASSPALAAEAGDRARVIAAYQSVLEPLLAIPTGFTGNVAACDRGTISEQNAQATLAAVNYIRGLVRLSPVVLNRARSANAQASALIIAANGSLSHQPARDARCWSKSGYVGASHGNLSLGWTEPGGSTGQATGPRAVLGYLADRGQSNAIAGHRRWLLWQGLTEIGTGDTEVSNTIVVIPEPFVSHRGRAWVSWPPAGAFPRELEPDGRWSLSYPGADFSRARVTMKAPDGRPITVRTNPIANGYADNTLTWEAALPADYSSVPGADYPVKVTVSGVRLPGGKAVSKRWTTTLVRASSGAQSRQSEAD